MFSISKRTGEKWRCAPHSRDYMLFGNSARMGVRVLSCAAKAAFVSRRGEEPGWAAGTRRHRRDDSTSVAHRAKEEVSSRVAASPRRIGSADPSSRLGSWSRVAPRLPQKTPKSRNLCGETAHRNSAMRSSRRLRAILTTPHLRDHSGRSRQYATSSLIRPSTGRSEPSSASDSSM